MHDNEYIGIALIVMGIVAFGAGLAFIGILGVIFGIGLFVHV